ncbi:hypothetical protein E2562_012922 [Oryza meyeriana var. granulata]|uniref:Uncharacterized protein n=1 Tax=Oryza meyeriana var. granulata TaxID=110450 RepID=A0A6G1CG16_9ORYZ|nr:hypothetical protein E2562_012922 [Oryza meyeriana var. granulata]
MGGLDLWEMLSNAAQRQPRRIGWTAWGDARSAAIPARCPPRPVAADGRGEGTSTRVRGRGEEGTTHGGVGGGGAEGEGAVVAPMRTADAAGRNAVAVAGGLVTHGGERVAGSVVAREEKRNDGGGGGELGTKRGLEERVALPPPKRRAVSAKRQFPPGCGRDAAVPLGRGRGRDCGVGPSDEAFAAPLADSEDGLLLKRLPSRSVLGVVEKVAVADGGASMANVQRHDVAVDVELMKSSHASNDNRVACKVGSLENGAEGAGRGKRAHSGELLGRKEELVQATHLLPKGRMVPATRRFPPGCGRDAVAPLARREEVKVGSNLEVMPVDVGGGVSKEVVATDGGQESVGE